MKNLILTLVLFFAVFTKVSAQEKPSNTTVFLSLLESRKNDFKDIMKEKLPVSFPDPAEVSYASKIGFGAAKESINISEANKTSYFISYFDYSSTDELLKSAPVIDEVLKIINMVARGTKYKGKDFTAENGDEYTQLTDLNGNLILSLTTTSGNKACYIMVTGQSFDAK